MSLIFKINKFNNMEKNFTSLFLIYLNIFYRNKLFKLFKFLLINFFIFFCKDGLFRIAKSFKLIIGLGEHVYQPILRPDIQIGE